jgi:hypothetical protein
MQIVNVTNRESRSYNNISIVKKKKMAVYGVLPASQLPRIRESIAVTSRFALYCITLYCLNPLATSTKLYQSWIQIKLQFLRITLIRLVESPAQRFHEEENVKWFHDFFPSSSRKTTRPPK